MNSINVVDRKCLVSLSVTRFSILSSKLNFEKICLYVCLKYRIKPRMPVVLLKLGQAAQRRDSCAF